MSKNKKKKSRPGPAARKKAKQAKKAAKIVPLRQQSWSMMPPPRHQADDDDDELLGFEDDNPFGLDDDELAEILGVDGSEDDDDFPDIALGWTEEEIEDMATSEILEHLGELGIPLTEEQARQDILAWDPFNPTQLGIMWETRAGAAEPADHEADFCWMAGLVLWKRLAPDRAHIMQIENLVGEGTDMPMSKAEDLAKVLPPWRQAWILLRPFIDPAWKSTANMVEAIDKEGDRLYDFEIWLENMLEAYQRGIEQDPLKWKEEASTFGKQYLEDFPEAHEAMKAMAAKLAGA